MARILVSDGVITIDTKSMDDEERQGILKIIIDLKTHETAMSMIERKGNENV